MGDVIKNPTLVLGMASIAYSQEGGEEGVTTDQVAKILEEKYGVMQAFYDLNEPEIIGALVNSMEGSLENLFLGGPVGDPYAEAGQDIAKEYRDFISSGIIEEMGIAGVPTKAALERRSLRFKGKKAPERRPSFLDTGLNSKAFTAWVEQ